MNGQLPDRRINAYRDDLAAERLRGQVDAPNYAAGETRQVAAASAPLRRAPRFDALQESELLHGERVTVYDENEGWSWAQAEQDSFVGYIPGDALAVELTSPTHRVSARCTHLYPAPDIKAPPLELLSMNARLAVAGELGCFAKLEDGRFAIASHLSPLSATAGDFVAVAEKFLGTPYLWGGRTCNGLDCSALIQLSLNAAGIACPRDTDMQEAGIGTALPDPRDRNAYCRGDLIFWKGHLGIMTDNRQLLHASAHHMATVIEPVAAAISRMEASDGPVSSVRRVAAAP